MKKSHVLVASVVLSIVPGLAEAAVHYVRAGATGNGSDWANAMGDLPTTLTRGDTYYIAAGSYGSHTFNDALSGSSYIYVTKATEADHGTDTGWSASYAGPATFGSMRFRQGYYDVDGKVGGGPGSWMSGHGFKITTTASGIGKVITVDNVQHIRIRHAEIYFSNLVGATTTTASGDLLYANVGGSDLIVQYCWMHDSARTIFYPIKWSNVTIEYSRIERNGVNWSSGNHSELFSCREVSNFTIRYNHFLDWKSTGGLIFGGVSVNVSPAKSVSSDIYIYGNIFEWTKNWGDTANDGAIGSWNHAWMEVRNVRVYNNTFVNITDASPGDASSVFPIVNVLANSVTQNNLWYNANPRIIAGSHDYNWFDSGTHSEANAQVGTGSPFVAAGDFRLSAATAPGTALTAPYDFDGMQGINRGADSVWDRGAYEHGAACSVNSDCNAAPSCRTNNGATCTAGVCIYPPADGVACADDGDSCTDDVCGGGDCTHPTRPAGSACEDGDPCTTGDQCATDGTCLQGATNICVEGADAPDGGPQGGDSATTPQGGDSNPSVLVDRPSCGCGTAPIGQVALLASLLGVARRRRGGRRS